MSQLKTFNRGLFQNTYIYRDSAAESGKIASSNLSRYDDELPELAAGSRSPFFNQTGALTPTRQR